MKTLPTIFFTLAVSLMLMVTAVSAQNFPSYQEARGVYDAMDKTVGQTGVWSKKPLAARLQSQENAAKLVKKAELLFGTNLGSPHNGQLLESGKQGQDHTLNLY